jgi:glyoxylase-like metal-dependent hydrolase (beta-lactamase superfamily II)
MGLTIHPLECGWLTTDFGTIVTGQSGQVRVPVPAFLIEHPQGLVLFDLGMHRTLTNSTDRLGPLAAMLGVEMAPEAQLSAQLAAVGHDPADVTLAVSSHLHFDHVGGLAELPAATLIVQADEWKAATDAAVRPGAYVRADFDLGHARKLVDGVFDLFGDGALVLHPTPGHSAGHQSLLVEGRTLLLGDACFCRLALDEDALPSVSHDADRHRRTFAWLRQRQAEGVGLVFSHDPGQWAQVRAGVTPWDR